MKYQGVDVEHPKIREYLKNFARQGVDKGEAARRVGMPFEIADKAYQEVKREKAGKR